MMERHLSHTRGCSLVVEDEYIVLMQSVGLYIDLCVVYIVCSLCMYVCMYRAFRVHPQACI